MSAVLSPCRRYRYQLERTVSMHEDNTYAYFGINPSTADESEDDATVRRWIGFTERFNSSRFLVGNAFAFRATDVNDLAKASDPVGPDNDKILSNIIQQADILVPCWGSRNKLPVELHTRLDNVLAMLKKSGKPVMAFGFAATGDPKHPLMLSYNTKLVEVI